jgi:hypothetical protein
VVGVVIAFDGQIEEVNVYPNHALFGKMYPRLVQSYALQAALLNDQKVAGTPATINTVVGFFKASGEKSKREKEIDSRNMFEVKELDDNRFQCTTRYEGQVVHRQMLKKNGVADANLDEAGRGKVEMRAMALGCRW